MKSLIFILAVLCFPSIYMYGQTASIERGCVPLGVAFEAPNASEYFWDFKDGASSNLQNPDHTFTDAGVYEVELRQGQGGALVGTITITVFADPIIQVTANPTSGCVPLEVDFTSNITLDPALSIQGVSWSFGDGTNSADLNPNHTYSVPGTYSVSLEITTNEAECNKTELFTDLIQVETLGNVSFLIDIDNACSAPSVVTLTNNSVQGSGLTYAWDFGNGSSSTSFSPGPVTYDADGIYTITLSVSNSVGCTQIFDRSITIGQPRIDIVIPDSICINSIIPIENNTAATNFVWQFGTNASVSTTTLQEPNVLYRSGGIQTVTLQTFNDIECISDTSFQIFVDETSAEFTLLPSIGCENPQPVMLSAVEKDLARYVWNNTIEAGSEYTYEHLCPDRDSFYIEIQDTFIVSLFVESEFGCTDREELEYYHRKPFAHFLPSTTSGCAPLEVDFDDQTEALTPVDTYTWLLGDGTTQSGNGPADISNTYDIPGEYYVQLIIQTEEGCRDTSAGRWILVGEPITAEYTISDTDICLHEQVSISLDNSDPRIDAWHVFSDDGRTSHCYLTRDMTHTFGTEPGTYDVTFDIDYNGCIAETIAPETINVGGANANLDYMFDCATPYDAMFVNAGLNADAISWSIDTTEIATTNETMFTFPDRGTYLATLVTEDPGSGCPADTSVTEIFITDPVADFEIPERVCDNIIYSLDASASADVDTDCAQGFLWNLPFAPRPREVDMPVIQHGFPQAGEYDVTLIVEDMHGCRDTITKSTTVYGIDPIIDASKDLTCLPDSITYTNLSTSDTTIVSAEWSFGGMDSIATVIYNPPGADTIGVSLILIDAIGCADTTVHILNTYEPVSNIGLSQGPSICVGEEITFSATDFTSQGSSLAFDWDFGSLGGSQDQNTSLTFEDPGTYPVTLYFEEIASGCGDSLETEIMVIPFPEAEFTSSLDNVSPICFPAQIDLTNNSTSSGQVSTTWFIDGDGPFTGDMPTFAFDKGTHTVDLIVTSVLGCADTISNSYTLVGPEGNISADLTDICVGDEITFTLTDTVDVIGWEWDFGDGIIQAGGNPAAHVFEFNPSSGATNVSLTLFSEDTGCETIEVLPITIDGPIADFDIDNLITCDGEATFTNLSEDATQFTWSVGGEVVSTDTDPQIDFDAIGQFEVTLVATNPGSMCSSSFIKEVDVDPEAPVASFTTASDLEYCTGLATFINTSTLAEQFTWSAGGDVFSNESNPTFNFGSAGEFQVTLTVTAGTICSDTTTETIQLNETVSIEIPNIFTPNNDGANDFFRAVFPDENLQEFIRITTFQIYDRWGQLVYDNEDPTRGWNGEVNDELAPAAVYAYFIEYELIDCTTESRQGNVTLIR